MTTTRHDTPFGVACTTELPVLYLQSDAVIRVSMDSIGLSHGEVTSATSREAKRQVCCAVTR